MASYLEFTYLFPNESMKQNVGKMIDKTCCQCMDQEYEFHGYSHDLPMPISYVHGLSLTAIVLKCEINFLEALS